MKLNERLTTVASFVDEGSQILDVGCDHAFLAIDLVERNVVKRAVASDVREGPLVHARGNIELSHLENRIEVRMGDGIETIDSAIDTVVISGMGGLNMVGILKYRQDLLQGVETLILSPNNDTDRLRKEIVSLGYQIVDEILVKDRNFFYPILKFRKGKACYTKEELVYGPILLEKKGPIFKEYIQREISWREQLRKTLPKKYFGRRIALKKEQKVLEKIL